MVRRRGPGFETLGDRRAGAFFEDLAGRDRGCFGALAFFFAALASLRAFRAAFFAALRVFFARFHCSFAAWACSRAASRAFSAAAALALDAVDAPARSALLFRECFSFMAGLGLAGVRAWKPREPPRLHVRNR